MLIAEGDVSSRTQCIPRAVNVAGVPLSRLSHTIRLSPVLKPR